MIDKIFYINLEYREDRRESIEEELEKLDYPPEIIERIDAIKKDNGAYGCTLSHLKALENAMENDYECVMIVEDDLGFEENINKESFNNLLKELFEIKDFDICSLGSSFIGKRIYKKTENIGNAINIQTTTGYIVRKNFFNDLYNNFEQSKKKIEEGKPLGVSSIDIVWKKLQGENKTFYVFEPPIVYQKPSYSDIENKFTYYQFNNVDYCLDENTKILCLKNNLEEEIPIKELRPGDTVKTYKQGYRKINNIEYEMVFNDYNDPSGKSSRMVLRKTEENGLTEDLYVSAFHYILVDELTSIQEYKERETVGGTFNMLDKCLVQARHHPDFEIVEKLGYYCYYQMTLENDGDHNIHYGIYTNGYLTETKSL